MNRKKRRKNRIRYFLLALLSIVLVPIILALLLNFPVLFSAYHSLKETMIFALSGFVFFTIFYYVIGQPVRTYIIAHELTHVIFAILTGRSVKKISFKRSNSYVKTSGTNVFISLGPYVLPLYSIIIILIYKLLYMFNGSSRLISVICYFIAGAGYSFHILSTLHYLKYDQPDMKRYGYFFSLTFVIIWLIIISSFLFWLMFPDVDLGGYLLNVLRDTARIYQQIIGIKGL